MKKEISYRSEMPLETLHAQLEHAVQRYGGKTTITQADLDVIAAAIRELLK